MRYSFMILFCAICIIIAFSNLSMGQTVTVKVKDTSNTGLIGAQVRLTRWQDSAKFSNVTDKSGIAVLTGVLNGHYNLRISYVGYRTLKDTITVTYSHRTFEFRLKDNSILIGETVIEAKRPLMRQEEDKIIIDPLPLVSTSTNALEVLEKTPGIYVDQDGGVYITGTMPASIYINGREQKMSTEDITTLLRSLPPGSIEKIEVMRTPSTKYDAETSGGIINIILKKGVKLGQSGSISAGMNQGVYGNRFAGFNLNHSTGKSTSYLNVNYNHNDLLEQINSIRSLTPDTILHQSSHSRQHSEQGYIGYGISYDAAKKTNISYDGRINMSFPKSTPKSANSVNDMENLLLTENDSTANSSTFVSLQQDFGIVRKFDTLGSEWETKLSYSFNSNNSSQNYLTNYTSPIYAQVQGNGNNKQNRHYVVFQSDLTYQLPKKIKLETGIKSSFQDYNSKSDYFNNQSGTMENDTQRTNSFNYIENINAAYAQASRTFGKWFTLKLGGRMEHTYMKGHQTIPSDTSFLINRVDWFPYVYLSRRIIKIMGIELQGYMIFRRTITRPGYDNLNPYIKYDDQFTYETGNPALKPQFTDNYEANISHDDMPIFAVGQNYTTDIFSSVVYKDKTHDNIEVRTYDNLGKDKETYLRAMVGIPPGGKYFFALGAQYNMNEFNGVYENQNLNLKRSSWRFFTFHSLNIFKNTKITVFGFMMVNGLQNFYTLKNFGVLNVGLTQTLLKKKLTITLNGRDILRTMVVHFQLNEGSIFVSGDRYTDNQRFGINIRYNFGMKKKEEKKGLMPNEEE